MCGLFGTIRPHHYDTGVSRVAAADLLDLGCLAEERGTDSAGIATLQSRTLTAGLAARPGVAGTHRRTVANPHHTRRLHRPPAGQPSTAEQPPHSAGGPGPHPVGHPRCPHPRQRLPHGRRRHHRHRGRHRTDDPDRGHRQRLAFRSTRPRRDHQGNAIGIDRIARPGSSRLDPTVPTGPGVPGADRAFGTCSQTENGVSET
jgi:hypothetical protein